MSHCIGDAVESQMDFSGMHASREGSKNNRSGYPWAAVTTPGYSCAKRWGLCRGQRSRGSKAGVGRPFPHCLKEGLDEPPRSGCIAPRPEAPAPWFPAWPTSTPVRWRSRSTPVSVRGARGAVLSPARSPKHGGVPGRKCADLAEIFQYP
jgi:hypothetical protein